MSVITYYPIHRVESVLYTPLMRLDRRKVLSNAAIIIRFSEAAAAGQQHHEAVELRLLATPSSTSYDMMFMQDIKIEGKGKCGNDSQQEMLVISFPLYRTRLVLTASRDLIDKLYHACLKPQLHTPIKPSSSNKKTLSEDEGEKENEQNNKENNNHSSHNTVQLKKTSFGAKFGDEPSLSSSSVGFSPLSKSKKFCSLPSHLSSPKRSLFPCRLSSAGYDGEETMQLTVEQQTILQACLSGQHIFFTGSAGTGKSTLLKTIITRCKAIHGKAAVFVLAATGLAACALGGITVHHFLSLSANNEELGPSKMNADGKKSHRIAMQLIKRKAVVQRCRLAKVIVIDEISMLSPDLFELIDEVLRLARNQSGCPMGGVQLIVTGDFCQLPPVSSSSGISSSSRTIASYYQSQPKIQSQIECISDSHGHQLRYCFQSALWKEIFPSQQSFLLQSIKRQSEDREFITILEELRMGALSEHSIEKLTECVQKPLQSIHGVLPTLLVTHRKDGDLLNQEKLNELPGIKIITTIFIFSMRA